MNKCLAFLGGIMLVSSAMLAQLKVPSADLRSWLESSRPLAQSKLLFYSDGQFAYKLTIQESHAQVLQWYIPQHRTFSLWGALKDGSLLRDTNPRVWTGALTLRVSGEDEDEDEYLTRNWREVTIVMERLPQ
jgi:hypothetical protein